jgi:hypothetical protein
VRTRCRARGRRAPFHDRRAASTASTHRASTVSFAALAMSPE